MHVIKTILATEGGFWTSPLEWNDPNYAFEHRYEIANRAFRPLSKDDEWYFIGAPGWFLTDENKALYERLATLTYLHHWHPREYCVVDIILDDMPPIEEPRSGLFAYVLGIPGIDEDAVERMPMEAAERYARDFLVNWQRTHPDDHVDIWESGAGGTIDLESFTTRLTIQVELCEPD